jgi:superfamily I DNA/RNA helicase
MHGVDTAAARDFLAPDYGEIVFGSDALIASRLTEIAPLVRELRSYFWRPEWTETARFWLRPPLHALEQGRSFVLTPKQREFAAPQPGHRRIRGVAGSGKTLILAERAARLASEGKTVLVVTFNITLWHYIHDMVARAPYRFDWERITFTHFHGFCGMLFNRFERNWPLEGEAGDGYFRDTVPKAVHALVDEARQNGAGLPVYDAILIDEGQDFSLEWYRLLCRFLGERNELLLVCDQRQNVYGCELGWLDEGMKGTGFRGRWGELKTAFRLPPLIADATQKFCRSFDLDEGVQADSNQQGNLFQPHLVWRNISDDRAVELMWQTFQQLKASGVSPSDMVFLLLGKRLGLQAVGHFAQRGIEVNHVFDPDEGRNSHKRSFWLGDGRLKMCTVESFKGWEIRNVVLLIPERTVRDQKRLDVLVYTAMTRSRENLIVLNSSARYADFGATLPSHWQ